MKFKILIYDDELDDRAPSGSDTRKSYYSKLGSDLFDFLWAKDPTELQLILRADTPAVALVDFVLGDNSDARAILSDLQHLCPIGIITSHLPQEIEPIRQTVDAYDVFDIFMWDELLSKDARDLVRLRIERAIRNAKGLAMMQMGEDEPLRILQLSDLHFGSGKPEAFAGETSAAALQILRHWKHPPHFIAVTGDIADKGLPHHYSEAAQWLVDFARKLDSKWDNSRFLLIPGNHDVCRPLGLSVRIDGATKAWQESISKVDQELLAYAFEPFRHFCSSLNPKSGWNGRQHYWVSGQYRQLGVIFFGYNTCEQLDDYSTETMIVIK